MTDLKTMEYSHAKCIQGFPFPKGKMFTTENITNGMNHYPQDGDILLCSYPKTGSTWMQYIVLQIVSGGKSYPETNKLLFEHIPMMEVCNVNYFENLKTPMMYKNHFSYNLMKHNPKAKYIYTYRNPADILASMYYFINEVQERQYQLDEFFEQYMRNNMPYGDFFDHFWSFYRNKDKPNLLLVAYEDMKFKPRAQILKIAKFLGERYYETLLNDDEQLEHIIKVTDFSYMKKNLKFSVVANDNKEKIITDFFRKGVVGDGKNIWTSNQMEQLQNKIKFRMQGTEFVELWPLQSNI